MWVVHLKNADASQAGHGAARGLRRRRGGTAGGGGGRRVPPVEAADAAACREPRSPTGSGHRRAPASAPGHRTGGGVGQPQTGGFIQADPATNSLIITAPEPLYRQLRAMIDQLDQRRAQVYIESMIVEVAGGDAADFGFEWLGSLGRNGNKSIQARRTCTTGSGARHHQHQHRPGPGHAQRSAGPERRPGARASTASPR
jgi:general secretion pathway protein D